MPTRPAPLVAAGGVGLVAFAVVAALVAASPAPTWLDRAALDAVAAERGPAPAEVFAVLTWFGDVLVWAPILLVVTGLLARATRSVAPLLLGLVAGTCSGAAVTVTKLLVERPRPAGELATVAEGGFGFPSAHATNSATVYPLLAVLLGAVVRSRWLRAAVWGGALLVVATVGVSRVVLGVHSPTDVLGGWLLAASGLAVLLGAALLRGLSGALSPPSLPATGRAGLPGAPRGSGAPRPPGRPRS